MEDMGNFKKTAKRGIEHFSLIRGELREIYRFCWGCKSVETIFEGALLVLSAMI